MTKGLFIGNSHANGGIPSEIAETGTKIEIEGNEYYICNEAYNSDDVFEFKSKTNKEILDFIYTEFACKLNQDIMHTGDFIVCKVVVADKKKKNRKGTIKQILNEMQGEKNCKVESGNNYKNGGAILLAPNGNKSNLTPEQYKLVRTPEFKAWFGDWENDPENASKVVDENGEPLICYHGTNVDFYEFDLKYFGKTDKGWYGKGFYFTPNKNFTFAKDAVSQFGGKEVNLKLFLNIKNPLYGQAYAEQQSNLVSSAKDRDKDGVVVLYDYGHEKESEIAEIIVWDSKNIKLADGTNTTFDSDNPDIRFDEGGLIAPNGKKSNLNAEQYKLVRTKAFKAWFGDWENDPENASKVVDVNGEPLVVFHGTASDFNIFKIGRTGGIFLTNNKNSAERFSSGDLKRTGSNPKILNCFINIKKYYDKNTNDEILVDNYYQDYFENRPFIKKQSQKNILKNKFNKYFMDLVSFGIVNEKPLNFLIEKGYDGIIIDANNNSNSYIVFESNQIKLADGTNTTFDTNNPDIRYDLGGKIKVNQSEDRGDLSYFIDGKKVGYAKYQFDLESSLSEKLSKYKSELYLEMVEVDEDFRNKGIAKELLKKVISIAENLKVEVVSLRRESGLGCDYGSDYDNYLKGIYESLGFVEFDEEDCAMKLVLKNRNDLGGNIKTQNNDMEKHTYALTLRPFDVGTYPKENFVRFVEEEADNYKFGLLEYSKELPIETIKHFSLAPVSDLMKYDGKEFYYYENLKGKAEILRNPYNIPYVKVTEFDEDNDIIDETKLFGQDFLENIKNGRYRIIDDSEAKELQKGIKVEQEHRDTLEKIASGDISVDEAIKQTAEDHIAENPNYYDELEKIEKKSDNKEMIIEQEEIKTDIESYKNPYQINKAIEKLIDQKGDSKDYSSKELEFISYYSGYGGLEKFGEIGKERLKGLMYEFYTPDAVVKKMWALAYKYGYGTIADNSVFEPSVGIGAFLKYAPSNVRIVANEINEYSAKICEILYPQAKVELKYFEQNFIKNNLSIKSKIDDLDKYSLVIGNPPYGVLNSKYIGMGEDKFTTASNYTEYFITRGLDLLVQDGLLIYIVGAEQYNGGSLFLDSGLSKVKEMIFDKADLVDAYRLPVNIFERTGVSSEIVVFKKR